MAQGGKWLNEMGLFNENSPFTKAEALQIWDNVSTKLIQQASGQVRAVLRAVKPTNVYQIVEIPELQINNKVLELDKLNFRPRFTFGGI